MLGRRTVRIGDVVVFDTPYINGVADVIDGPDSVRGTKTYPKWLFRFRSGVLADGESGYVGPLGPADEGWFEDNPHYMSIVGVDDENIGLFDAVALAAALPHGSGPNNRRQDGHSGGGAMRDTAVFGGVGWSREQVGEVDADGKVYEGAGWNRKQIGEVDADGNVYEGTGWSRKQKPSAKNNWNRASPR